MFQLTYQRIILHLNDLVVNILRFIFECNNEYDKNLLWGAEGPRFES